MAQRQRLFGIIQDIRQAEEVRPPVTADEFLTADELEEDPGGPPHEDAGAGATGLGLMEAALERLRSEHLAFRRPEPKDVADLDDLRLKILTAVTESPELEEYYREAWSITVRTEAATTTGSTTAHRRIAVMQIELMTRAFYVLQLQRFANAPENHGWMTLFRSWGRSGRFNTVFDELQPTLAPDLVKFYGLYLRDRPDKASKFGCLPVHHPWEKPEKHRGRGLYMDSGLVEARIELEVRPGERGHVDSAGPDRANETFEQPSDTPDAGGHSNRPPNT